MNLDVDGFNDLDFTPSEPPIDMLACLAAETVVVNAIVEGSGGPNNVESTDSGLRFVRYLLCLSSSASRGVIPNFKDWEIIRQTAREFIRLCGGGSTAIKILESISETN